MANPARRGHDKVGNGVFLQVINVQRAGYGDGEQEKHDRIVRSWDTWEHQHQQGSDECNNKPGTLGQEDNVKKSRQYFRNT